MSDSGFQYQYPYGTYGIKAVHYILSESGSEEPAKDLILTAGIWTNALHDEILVFNNGWWYKDRALWLELQKADWKDVILDAVSTRAHSRPHSRY
jgi:transitional endoplasmic reticulum ATPase